MNINNVKLERTAVKESDYPNNNLPEVALAGRSNVGKSSLINYLINRKSLARVSSKPGKTRVINFYNVEDKLYLVDLPGYGFANVSKEEKESWGKMIEAYLLSRNQLALVVMLIDIRHEPSELDRVMLNWIKSSDINFVIVATKADKITKSDIEKRIGEIAVSLNISESKKIIPFSSEKRFGREELLDTIQNNI